jgi:hypothetical protein
MGFFIYNLSLSGSSRDKNVSGGARPIHTLKDLAHHGRAIDMDQDHPTAQFNKTPYPMLPDYTDVVYLSIDDLVYHNMHLLEQLSGSPMVFWTSFYPDLCGAIEDCTYYCTGESSFTEVVGPDQCNFIYPNQHQWNFMASDIIAIEKLDKSQFTVYRVKVTPRPDLLKQLVVLAPIHTVNLPLAVVEKLIQSSKQHPFLKYTRDGRIPKLGPCDNIVVSRGIVIMRNGTPRKPTLCFMFEGNTDPDNCLSVPERVFRWLHSLHNNTGGRKLTASEFNRRLIAYINDPEQCSDEEKQMANHWLPVRGAAFVQLMKAVASYDGILPNICYFVSLTDRDESAAATDMEHENAKAVGAAPPIAPSNPNHVVQDANASKTVKAKADDISNTVRYSKDWKRINQHVIGRLCTYMSEQTGYPQHSVTLQDREEVLDKRTRPAQVAREDTAANGPVFDGGIGVEKQIGETNVKGETLHKGKPAPRSVNDPPYPVSIESGRLAMALDPVLKALHCYDPGQNPQGIGDGLLRVYTMAGEAERQSITKDTHPDINIPAEAFMQADGRDGRTVAICCNDYTNADLLHSEDSYMVLETIIRHFFHPAHLKEALDIYRNTFNMIMQCGPYQRNSKWTNCSGTGITTILNTCVFMVRDILITLVAYVFRSMEMHGDLTPGGYILDRKGNEIKGKLPTLTFDTFTKHLDRVASQQRDLFKNRLDTHIEGDRDFFPQGEFKVSELLHKNGKSFHKNDLIRYVWKHVGCFFGDDSVRSAYPYIGILRVKIAMRYVGAQDGMIAKLDAVCVPSEEGSVEYLSRQFFALHAGSAASYCKIEKALAKLTVAASRDPWRYVSKILGYLSADWRAPVVGAYLQAVCSMYGLKVVSHIDRADAAPGTLEMIVTDHEGRLIEHPYGNPAKLESGLREGDPAVLRLFSVDRDLYYKLLNGSYPWEEEDTDLAYEHAAAAFGVSSAELKQFDATLRSQSTWDGIKSCALPGTLKEFAPCAFWPEQTCNKWQDIVEPLTVGSCDYGRRHPDDAPNTTRTYPFSTMLYGLSPQMIDWGDQQQVDKLQEYVASCTGSQPPKSNVFPKQLVAMVKPEQVPEQLNSLFGVQTEGKEVSSTLVSPRHKGNKLFETEAEAIEVANVMRALLDTDSSNSQDSKTTTDKKSNTTTKKPNTKTKKQKVSAQPRRTPSSSSSN